MVLALPSVLKRANLDYPVPGASTDAPASVAHIHPPCCTAWFNLQGHRDRTKISASDAASVQGAVVGVILVVVSVQLLVVVQLRYCQFNYRIVRPSVIPQ